MRLYKAFPEPFLGARFVVSHPTMKEYSLQRARVVTPIYPTDAATIINELDLHASIEEPIRALEIGSGNGAFSMYLARAVYPKGKVTSLDISERYSKAARQWVDGFRRGIYSSNVEFITVESISPWLQLQAQSTELFSAAMIDTPSPEIHIESLTPLLEVDAFIAVFSPSITQFLPIKQLVSSKRLPLRLERVLELSPTGAKEWDLRYTAIRQKGRDTCEESLVCRPKVGVMSVGGGFVAILRKRRNRITSESEAEEAECASEKESPLEEEALSSDQNNKYFIGS